MCGTRVCAKCQPASHNTPIQPKSSPAKAYQVKWTNPRLPLALVHVAIGHVPKKAAAGQPSARSASEASVHSKQRARERHDEAEWLFSPQMAQGRLASAARTSHSAHSQSPSGSCEREHERRM
jgi:hypothetical protein